MSGDPIYTEMIIEYSRNPSNYGKLENPHITRHDSNPLCGDSIDLYLNIVDNKISDVKVKAYDSNGNDLTRYIRSSFVYDGVPGGFYLDTRQMNFDNKHYY